VSDPWAEQQLARISMGGDRNTTSGAPFYLLGVLGRVQRGRARLGEASAPPRAGGQVGVWAAAKHRPYFFGSPRTLQKSSGESRDWKAMDAALPAPW